MFKKFLGLTMALLLGVGSMWAENATYSKVTSAPDDWSGDYLIVYESGNLAFNGSLSALDVVNNGVAVTISNNKITLDEQYQFTITSGKNTGYWYIQSASGCYIWGTGSNGLSSTQTKSSAKDNSIALSGSTFTIKGYGGSKTLSFNNTEGQKRFRFLGSTLITLYKKDVNPSSVTAPTFDVAAGTYTENKTVKVSNYDATLSYYYTLDGSTPTNASTPYVHTSGVSITSSCTLKMIAYKGSDKSNVTSAAYTINKPIVFASLEELVAANLTSGQMVTVSFENVAIKDIYVTTQSKRQGVYFDIQKDGHDIEIYYSAVEVPAGWVADGTLSGTMTCPWTYYERGTTWELAPASGWAWTDLTYSAPVVKTLTALAVSGTPTKTTYNVGDAFETAGLVVTATYSDESTATISTGFNWEIDYGTGHDALVAGATSVDVMVYTDEVMSEVFTVEGLTVTVPVTLESIVVSGTPTKTSYYAGDAFETAGLVVTGHYSDGSDNAITEGIEWTVDPETLAEGATSVDVIAGVGAVVSEVYTVNDLTVTKNPYKTATISSFSATSGDINTDIAYEAFKGNASTDPYLTEGAIRLYQNGGYITVTAGTGLKIASVKITTSATYASTTVGYCVDDEAAPTTGETVNKESDYTINGLNNGSVSIYCLGTDKNTRLEIAAIEVKYSGNVVNELKSIVLSGTYPTEFTKGDEFSHEGMVVTAKYTVNDDADVTSSATFSGYDMNTIGEHTVTVSYTENEITKTATYTLTVKKAPFVPTPVEAGVESVNFTAIDPYKSLPANGSADMTTYEGTSFSIEFAKKAGTNNAPKFYKNGNAVRVYVDNTLTIKGAAAIAYVDIAWTDGYVDELVKIEGLGTTEAVVTFSTTARFTEITVYYYYPKTFADLDLYTLYLDYEVAIPAGVHAYIGTKHESGNFLELTEIENVIPVHEAVLIQAEEAEAKKFEIRTTGATANPANELKGVSQNTLYTALGSILTLNTYDGVVGFYQPNPNLSILKANRCYLPMGASASVRIVMPGQPSNPIVTGVDELNAVKATKALVNGKLVIVRGAKVFDVNGKMLK